MADEADVAAEFEQSFIAHSNAVRKAAYKPLSATGHCHYCTDTLDEPGAKFCDDRCRADYEFEQKVRGQQGYRH